MERRSGTPLAARLGFKPGMRVWFHEMPPAVRAAIAPERLPLDEMDCASEGLQAAHLFASRRDHLERELGALRALLASNGFLWVSWPQEGRPDLDDGTVADLASAQGWIERDRCTLDGWSGVKLVPAAVG